jgi:uncharacterized protein YkwD
MHQKQLTLQQARLYMLALVNKDRARYHLSPLSLDSVATVAGQLHADEMALVGYLSHWDTLGRKPDQRYTEAGGFHHISENLADSFSLTMNGNDLGVFKPVNNHLFSPKGLDRLESAFMSETPPNDNHRKQILTPEHNGAGIGLSYAENERGASRLMLAQELVDKYGEYSKLPNEIVRGSPLVISGRLLPPLTVYSVCVYWEPVPKPMTKEELEQTPRSYDYPYNSFIHLFATDRPATMKTWFEEKCEHFSVSITPTELWKPGLYYVEICAMQPKFKEPIRVSSRTVHLE